jgi:hypothetical protein
MSRKELDNFVRLLKASPSGAVFNPWWQIDQENDIGRITPIIRRQQLRAYVQERLGRAQIVIIGEALGYRSGHFSGIPMTSERMLLRKQQNIVVRISPHEQTECLSDCFFGTDGDECLGRVAKDWRAAGRIRFVERVPVAFIRSAPRAVEQSYA